jgi:hypothetical protein
MKKKHEQQICIVCHTPFERLKRPTTMRIFLLKIKLKTRTQGLTFQTEHHHHGCFEDIRKFKIQFTTSNVELSLFSCFFMLPILSKLPIGSQIYTHLLLLPLYYANFDYTTYDMYIFVNEKKKGFKTTL